MDVAYIKMLFQGFFFSNNDFLLKVICNGTARYITYCRLQSR